MDLIMLILTPRLPGPAEESCQPSQSVMDNISHLPYLGRQTNSNFESVLLKNSYFVWSSGVRITKITICGGWEGRQYNELAHWKHWKQIPNSSPLCWLLTRPCYSIWRRRWSKPNEIMWRLLAVGPCSLVTLHTPLLTAKKFMTLSDLETLF